MRPCFGCGTDLVAEATRLKMREPNAYLCQARCLNPRESVYASVPATACCCGALGVFYTNIPRVPWLEALATGASA